MYISALPYKSIGEFSYKINSDDYSQSIEDFGIQEFSVDNEYIQALSHAGEVALADKNRLSKRSFTVEGLGVCFTPEIQLWDCILLYELNTGINQLFYVVSLDQSKNSGELGTTTLTVIKL
jgi:hypothetical protein